MRSILAAGAGAPQPRPPGQALVLQLPVVPTRSLADYAVGSPLAQGLSTDPGGGELAEGAL